MFTIVSIALLSLAGASQVSPIEQVVSMISDLEAKVIAEGKDAQKVYDEYAEWCEDRSRNLGFETKNGKAEVADLKAKIEEETANSAALETKIEELSADIQTDQSDLDAATKIRKKEAIDFATEEKELTEVLSMLERATSILTKELAKNGASMLQLKSASSLTDALSVMVQAAAISSADASRLTALVQTTQESDDSDEQEPGAPASATYENHSEGIIGTLEGLTEKAQGQLDKARKAEATSKSNYMMLKQSLEDQIKFANKDMDKAKNNLAASQESKAAAEGDLTVTSKDLAEDISTKSTLHQDCMSAAEEFERSTKSRGEELSALAQAKKVIKETTGGAAEQTYGFNQMSLLQLKSSSDLGKAEAVRFVRDLARKFRAPALAQLASRMSSAIRLGDGAGTDPFAKIEELIRDMIVTLEEENEDETSHKAWCDKELSENNAKKDDLTFGSNKLNTKIAQDQSASKKLKEQIATLQGEMASMSKAKAEADQLREEEKTAFEKNSAEMKTGIDGVQKALSVLKEYYAKDPAHAANQGAGDGIIGLLEVCESDFTKGLTEMTAEEETAATEYRAYVKQDQIAMTMKDKDVQYKTQEAASLDNQVAGLSGDLATATDELNAVSQYLEKLKRMCTVSVEPYAERQLRRQDEIAGLKQALQILDGESVLLQKSSKHTLRGTRAHSLKP